MSSQSDKEILKQIRKLVGDNPRGKLFKQIKELASDSESENDDYNVDVEKEVQEIEDKKKNVLSGKNVMTVYQNDNSKMMYFMVYDNPKIKRRHLFASSSDFFNLNSVTVNKLKKLAKNLYLSSYHNLTKKELINLIQTTYFYKDLVKWKSEMKKSENRYTIYDLYINTIKDDLFIYSVYDSKSDNIITIHDLNIDLFKNDEKKLLELSKYLSVNRNDIKTTKFYKDLQKAISYSK